MTMNKEIPEKFFISGHSYGGFISSLFACAHPDRIDGLFLNSPIGAEAEPEDSIEGLNMAAEKCGSRPAGRAQEQTRSYMTIM